MEGHFLNDYRDYLSAAFGGSEIWSSSDPSAQLHTRLLNLRAFLRSKHADVDLPCTASSKDDCSIICNLTPWNQILYAVRIELVEDAPGELVVRSMQGRFYEPFDRTVILEACIAFHWLLKRHNCIRTVHLNSYYYLTSDYTFLFHHALSQSNAVRKLAISCSSEKSFGGALLATAVKSMAALTQLELREVSLGSAAMSRIGRAIDAENILTKLTFFGNCERPQSSTAFLDSLRSCTNLRSIKLGIMFVGTDSASRLANLLQQNRALEKIEFWNVNFTVAAFGVVTTSLSTGLLPKLQRLKFVGCVLHPAGLAILAEVLRRQSTITHFSIEASCLGTGGNSIPLALVDAISVNPNLHELCLTHARLGEDATSVLAQYLASDCSLDILVLKDNPLMCNEVVTLLKALDKNTSGAVLYLGHVTVKDSEELDILRTLEAMSASSRVQITFSTSGYLYLTHALRTNGYRATVVALDDQLNLTAERLRELFTAIGQNSYVTQLSVKSGQCNEAAVDSLGRALAANKTLMLLELYVNIEPSCLTSLFVSLRENKSLSKLVMRRCRFDCAAASAFLDMLKVNRTLNHFSTFRGDVHLLKKLEAGLLQNYTLLRLIVDPECVRSKTTFEVEEMLRRNRAVLSKAVRCALTRGAEKNLAVAFERVCGSSSLVKRVMKVGGLPAAQANACIRSTSRYIKTKYLVLTGVIRETLECFRSRSVQLSQLNQECLERIFGYLKLTDVLSCF